MVAREGGGKPGKHGVLEAIEERVSRGRGATLLDERWDKDSGVQVARRAGGEAGEVMGVETRVTPIGVSQVPQEPRVESHPLKGMRPVVLVPMGSLPVGSGDLGLSGQDRTGRLVLAVGFVHALPSLQLWRGRVSI